MPLRVVQGFAYHLLDQPSTAQIQPGFSDFLKPLVHLGHEQIRSRFFLLGFKQAGRRARRVRRTPLLKMKWPDIVLIRRRRKMGDLKRPSKSDRVDHPLHIGFDIPARKNRRQVPSHRLEHQIGADVRAFLVEKIHACLDVPSLDTQDLRQHVHRRGRIVHEREVLQHHRWDLDR